MTKLDPPGTHSGYAPQVPAATAHLHSLTTAEVADIVQACTQASNRSTEAVRQRLIALAHRIANEDLLARGLPPIKELP